MTEFRLPPLVVDFNLLWLQADVRGDSADWAERAVAELLSRRPRRAIKGMAAVSPVDLEGRDAAEAWHDLLDELAPDFPGEYPRDINPMQTKAGECGR